VIAIVHHPAYAADMPEGHRFPMNKYAGLARVLTAQGLVRPEGFVRPAPVTVEQAGLAHDRAYVAAVLRGDLPLDAVRRIGLPLAPSVVERAFAAAGGTLTAARLALAEGLAGNAAGGSHHAARSHGAGFCILNDVAIAAAVLLAEGAVSRILVVDLDVHQGDGTALIFAGDSRVFTFSMHAEKNFPARKAASRRDVGLADGTGDADYLSALETVLPEVIAESRPDLAFYNAGVDPHKDDRLGRLALSDDGVLSRDRMVIKMIRDQSIPLTLVTGGGYGDDVDAVARRHALVFRAAVEDAQARAGTALR